MVDQLSEDILWKQEDLLNGGRLPCGVAEGSCASGVLLFEVAVSHPGMSEPQASSAKRDLVFTYMSHARLKLILLSQENFVWPHHSPIPMTRQYLLSSELSFQRKATSSVFNRLVGSRFIEQCIRGEIDFDSTVLGCGTLSGQVEEWSRSLFHPWYVAQWSSSMCLYYCRSKVRSLPVKLDTT